MSGNGGGPGEDLSSLMLGLEMHAFVIWVSMKPELPVMMIFMILLGL